MATSKKPNAKSITRDKKSYTATWDKKATYEKQDLDYRMHIAKITISGNTTTEEMAPGSWHDTDPGAGATSKKFTPDMSDVSESKRYTLVEIRVRSKEKGKDWSGYDTATFSLLPPPNPTVSVSDNSSSDATVFGWEVKASDTDHKPYDHCKFYSVLVTNNTFEIGQQVTGWTEVNWGISPSATATSGTVSFQEGTSGWDLTHNTYTRWFKVVSVGPAGECPVPAYIRRTYSSNNKPVEDVQTETEPRADGGYTINVHWETSYSEANPIDAIEVEYVVTQPDSTTQDEGDVRKAELLLPPGASFIKADTKNSTDVKRSGSTTIVLDSAIPNNNVVFVRVNTVYEGISRGGQAYIPPEAYGKLSPPSGLVVGVPDPGTRRVGVTATNNTGITASFIGVFFRSTSFEERCIGIIPYEQSGQEVTVVLPTVEEDPTIVVRAYVADYSPIAPGADSYTISNIKMQSTTNQGSGSVPKAPSSVNVTRKPNSSDTVIVRWNWTWTEANIAEISWSQDPDAWKSNNEPTAYQVKNTHSGEWYISGLSAGSWYFKVRLIQQSGDNTYYGAYSDLFGPVKISEAPATPRLTINPATGIVTVGSSFTCYWVYASGDGTPQASAMLYEVDIDPQTGAVTPRDGAIKSVTNEQYMTLNVDELGWIAGSEHYIAIRVTSLSGESSEGMSPPVKITVANPLDISFDLINTSLEEYSYQTTDEHGDLVTITVPFALRRFPLTIAIDGITSDMTTTLTIEKENYCSVSMPYEQDEDVYDGELIYTNTKTDGTAFVINSINDLLQRMDDRETYRIIATVQDSLGQKVELDPLVFQVFWDEQPTIAIADIEYDNFENVAYITPKPTDTPATGAVCDIYRLSIDSPELIVENAEYYQTYVDPYPTLGTFGGYRIVSKSKYNDWITDDGTVAWSDYESTEALESLDYYIDANGDVILVYDENKISPEELDEFSMHIDSQGCLIYSYGSNARDDFSLIDGDLFVNINDSLTKLDLFALIIDFDKEQLILPYDIDVSNTWTKDFEQTAYLGGTIVGDWNKAVTKSTSINLTIPIEQCQDEMKLLTKLAEYPNVCHVRTPDGSSYYANVSVKENKEKKQVRTKSTVSLEISKVSSPNKELDGLTYEAWIESKEE